MALLGTYVGVIPVGLGMLFLPFVDRVPPGWVRVVLAATVGLLAFLAVDGYLEGTELGQGQRRGVELLFLGAGLAYLALAGLDAYLRSRRSEADSGRRRVAAGADDRRRHRAAQPRRGAGDRIGLRGRGRSPWGFLVIGRDSQHDRGIAIVAPLAAGKRPSLVKLGVLGVIAGAPAILGAFLGASVTNPELSIFLLGIGVGAIIQVIVQIWPSVRDEHGRGLYPASVAGIIVGGALLYATSLLITV